MYCSKISKIEYFKNLKEILINFQICVETDVFGASWSPTFWNRESCQRKNTKNAQSIKKTYWEKKWSFIIGKSWSIFMPNTFLKKNWSVLSISQLKAFGVYGVSLLLTIALVKMKAIWSWNVTISRSHEQCFIEPCPASDIQKNLVKLAPYHGL